MTRTPTRDLFAQGLQVTEIEESDEWGMDRNEGIGGSEAGSVLGLNKYHTALDLLEEKVTRTSLREFSEAQELRMDCGHALEALTLKTFATKELKIPYTISLEDLDAADSLGHLSKHLFVNPRWAFAFAHVDGLYRLNDELGIVDAKASFRDPWQEVPEYYIAQLAHYNAVIGGHIGYIAGMFMDHPYPRPRGYRFDFTAEQLKLVMKAEALFWKYVVKMRGGYSPGQEELRWLESTLAQMGEEFMAGVESAPDPDAAETISIVLAREDKELLVRYAALKQEGKALYTEIEAIGEYFKKASKVPNVSFVSEDGTELAKKSTIQKNSLDREAMVEAGVPVDAFYTTSPQTSLNMKKALKNLAASVENTLNAGEPRTDLLIEVPLQLDDLADYEVVTPSRQDRIPQPENAFS
jgi:predicted phage-related endonuclease